MAPFQFNAPFKPNVKSFQDMPPRGGFPNIIFDRQNTGPRGPSGMAIWAAAITSFVFGFYLIAETAKENRTNRDNVRESRMALSAYFSAETDQILQQAMNEQNAKEAAIMKDVKGWKVGESVYSKRWSRPVFALKD